jgi:hypothetical protein
METNTEIEKPKHLIPWLRPDEDHLCGAKNRQGLPCRKWKLKGRPRCKLHGGASVGPRQPHVTTGLGAIEVLKETMFQRVKSAYLCEKEMLFQSGFDFTETNLEWIRERIMSMPYPEFCQNRHILSSFTSGDISVRKLIFAINVKKRKRQEMELQNA